MQGQRACTHTSRQGGGREAEIYGEIADLEDLMFTLWVSELSLNRASSSLISWSEFCLVAATHLRVVPEPTF